MGIGRPLTCPYPLHERVGRGRERGGGREACQVIMSKYCPEMRKSPRKYSQNSNHQNIQYLPPRRIK